jgi:hypothetical protein
MIRFALLMTVVFPQAGLAEEATIVPSRINSAVYEVIVPKPPEESVTYEKPLPMDFIPFIIRNDKYYSIGTAFAVNGTEFITAAHVLNLGVHSQFKELFLRDINGKVLAVDQIIKYSSRRDFAVLTVKERLSPEHLEVNPDSQVNEKVYAAGNALGQGIVIRDGLYTSNTPEEIDGAWSWIRFSAPASPGNSGGPLLDHTGKVIGMIIGKSPNENLNIALPIAEILKDGKNLAEIYDKSVYQLDIFDSVKTGTLDTRIKLPMEYGKFREAYVGLKNEFGAKLLKELLAENRETLFPNGEGSLKLLYKSSTADFPQFIVKRPDGNWDMVGPEKMERSDLGNKGHLIYGRIKNTMFLKIQKPENMPLKDFYFDSKSFMDLILKGIPWVRAVGPEKIKITSLGKRDNEYVHLDSYGRKWLVKSWPIPYNDQEVVIFTLPVPGGAVALMRIDQTGEALEADTADLKVFTDFVNVSFDGTFKKWREYLEMKEILPRPLTEVGLTLSREGFQYNSKRFKLSCGCDAMKLSDQNMLRIGFGYFRSGDSVIWDVTRLVVNEDNFKPNGFKVNRNMKPDEALDEVDLNQWQRLLERDKPFDGKSYPMKDNTAISTVYKNRSPKKASTDVSILYDVSYVKTGIVEQDEMEASLNKIVNNLTVLESE